jgi:hypothetical protein
MIDPHRASNLIIELTARGTGHSYDNESGIEFSLELKLLHRPIGCANHVFGLDEKFLYLIIVVDLKPCRTVRSNPFKPHFVYKFP